MKQLLLAIGIIFSIKTFAQQGDSSTEKSHLKISGSVDGYYRYNFNNPKAAPFNSLTSFTKSSNSFELGMASLRLDHSIGKVSATVDLGFGTRAEEFAYNDANTRLAIKQAYLSYSPFSALKFTLGSWATHVGYELVDPYLNRNYSMSYMFTNGPFTHTGLKAEYNLGARSMLMVGISNPTDYRTAPAMPKSLIAQYATSTKDNRLKLYVNFVGGKQSDQKKMTQEDLVASYLFSDKLSIGINGTIQSLSIADSSGQFNKSSWNAVAAYINIDPTPWFGLTLREEYVNDRDQYLGFKSMFASTLSANFKLQNLTIIPEIRIDNGGNTVFRKTGNQLTSTSASAILAAVYRF